MKQTGKVELSEDSIAPAERGLWYTTSEKLNEAREGLQQMIEAQDRVGYESGWVRFVESLEESWTSFYEEGINRFSNFQPWAGRIIKVRKDDPLLSYLVQSRHQSQHGNIAIEWEGARVQIAPNFYGHIRDLKVRVDGSFEVEANPLGNECNTVSLKLDAGRPRLPVVENRKHGQTFEVPAKHLGECVASQEPHDFAALAVKFYSELYGEALAKFGTNEA